MTILRYTFSLLVLLSFLTTNAQKKDSINRKRDWKPSFVLVAVDPVKMITGTFLPRQTYEGMVAIDFDTYLLIVEGGQSSMSIADTFRYQSAGTFYRVGVAKNFTPFDEQGNIFSLGISYASATFSQKLQFENQNDFFGVQSYDLSSPNSHARWWQINGMIQVKMFSQFYLGYEASLKFLKKTWNSPSIETWEIPGYGRNKKSGTLQKKLNVGLNYYLTWRFDLRKKQKPVTVRR